jgi:prefoldin subunit 5
MVSTISAQDDINNQIQAITETIQAISPRHVLWQHLQDELNQLRQILSRIKK